MSTVNDKLKEIFRDFPKSGPFVPSQFTAGIAEQLRDIAAQVETGDLVVIHFSFTVGSDNSRQKLEIEVV